MLVIRNEVDVIMLCLVLFLFCFFVFFLFLAGLDFMSHIFHIPFFFVLLQQRAGSKFRGYNHKLCFSLNS